MRTRRRVGVLWLVFWTAGCVQSMGGAEESPGIVALEPTRSAVAGETCGLATYEVAVDVRTVPFMDDTSSTAGLSDDYNIETAGWCAGGGTHWSGSGTGGDIVYRIQTDIACDLRVRMTTVSADMNITVVTDCADISGSCIDHQDYAVGGQTETIIFSAAPEVDYFIIVDGYQGQTGAFTLTVGEYNTYNYCSLVAWPVACDGSNDGARCFDEGNPCTDNICVGGTCTYSPDDTNRCLLDADACTDDLCSGGSCTLFEATRCALCDGLAPVNGTPPWVVAGDTTGDTDELNFWYHDGCAGGGAYDENTGRGPDHVYRLLVNQQCDLRVTMDPGAADMSVGVFTECGDLGAGCVAISDAGSSGAAESVDFTALTNTDYYVVVDGWNGDGGTYVLTVAELTSTGCQLAPPLELCNGTNDGTFCDDANPCTFAGTCTSGNCSEGLPNDNGVCDDGNPCTDDACSGGSCVGAPDDTNSCEAGDGCTLETCIGGSCVVEDTPSCVQCDAAFWEDSELPLKLDGDTTGGSDDFNLRADGSCAGGGSSSSSVGIGPDEVYRLRVDTPCNLKINVTPATSSISLYVVTDCGALASSCVRTDYEYSAGGEGEVIIAADADRDYFVIVDGYNNSAGAYRLTIEEDGILGCRLLIPFVVCDGTNDGELCDDDNSCTDLGLCESGVCTAAPNDSLPCTDDNACTDDLCVAGECLSANDDTNSCDDANPCTDDACVAGECRGTNDDTNSCTDGLLCTDDLCVAGACESGPTDCSGLNEDCRAGFCNPATGFCDSEPANDGNTCDDGDPCTDTDECLTGSCRGAEVDCTGLDDLCEVGVCNADTGLCVPAPADCSALDGVCRIGVCDPGSGLCAATTAPDDDPCDDDDPCTTGDYCVSGACAGEPVDCSDVCNAGTCDPFSGVCHKSPANEGGTCDDGDLCTSGDACTGGVCLGASQDCSSNDTACRVGDCDPGTGSCIILPKREGLSCDDADPCTKLDTCVTGDCVGEAKDCSAFDDPCNNGMCDAGSGACHGEPTHEGDACTADDGCAGSCNEGICVSYGACVDEGDGGPPGGDTDDPGPGGCGCAQREASPLSVLGLLMGFATLHTSRRRWRR